jgi:hypothetical protein
MAIKNTHITINGVDTNYLNLSVLKKIDRTLDFGSFVVPQSVRGELYKRGDLVHIVGSLNGSDFSEYQLVESDDRKFLAPINGVDYYNHNITLMEYTYLLQFKTGSNMEFPVPVDAPPFTCYEILKSIQLTTPMETLDLVNDTRMYSIEGDNLTSTLRTGLARLATDTPAPEFTFNNETVREMNDKVLDYLGGISRLRYPGILSRDDYNEFNELRVKDEDTKTRASFHDLAKYSTNAVLDLENKTYSNDIASSSIVEPSVDATQVFSTDEAILTTENAKQSVKKTIRDSIKVEMLVLQEDLFGADERVLYDITEWVLEYENWRKNGLGSLFVVDDLLNKKLKRNTVYYKRGTKDFLTWFDTYSLSTTTTLTNIIFAVQFREGVSPTRFIPQGLFDFENSMRFTYITSDNSRMIVERKDLEDIDFDSDLIMGQSARNLSTERAVKKAYNDLQMQGLEDYKTSMVVDSFNDIYNINDYTLDGFKLTEIEIQFRERNLLINYKWTKNFIKTSDFISLKGEIRESDISGYNAVVPRYYNYAQYIELNTVSEPDTSQMGSQFYFVLFSSFYSLKTNTPIKNAFLSSNDMQIENDESIAVAVNSSEGGDAFHFELGIEDSLIAGNSIVKEGSVHTSQAVEYKDINGELSDVKIEWADSYTGDKLLFPMIPNNGKGNILIANDSNYLIRTNINEAINFGMRVQIINNINYKNTFVLGDRFFKGNNLIRVIQSYDTIKIFGSANEVYRGNEKIVPKGIEVSRSLDFNFANEISIALNAPLPLQDYSSWAIVGVDADDREHLIIGVNQRLDGVEEEISKFYWNGKNKNPNKRYFDISIDFAGTIPDAPTNLVATVISSERIDYTWEDNSNNESSFFIELALDNLFTQFVSASLVGAGVTTSSFTNLDPETLYYARVIARNTVGDSAPSNTEIATTSESIPESPTNLVIGTITDTSVQVSWTDNSDNETNFVAYFSVTGEFGTYYLKDDTIPADSTTFVYTDLSENQEYFFRIFAENANGQSSSFAQGTATTNEVPTVTTVQPLITDVSFSHNSISWKVLNNDDDTATIYSEIGDATPETVIGIVASGVKTSLHTVSFLSPQTQYTIYAKAQATGKALSTAHSVSVTTGTAPVATYDYTFSYNGGEGGYTNVTRTGENLEFIIPPTPSEDEFYTFTGWSPTPPDTHSASNDGGSSVAEYSYNPPLPTLATPTGLALTATVFSWNVVPNATGYFFRVPGASWIFTSSTSTGILRISGTYEVYAIASGFNDSATASIVF